VLAEKMNELEAEAQKLANRAFSISSSTEVAAVLYDHLQLPAPPPQVHSWVPLV